MVPTAGHEPDDPLRQLYDRPGFMIRRAHQVATSIFLDAAAEFGSTTTQFGVLTVLASSAAGIDQITVARRLGLDRSTAGTVLRTLEQGGFVTRVVGPDRRRRMLELTDAGRERLAALGQCAGVALHHLLEPLTPSEAATLCRLLRKLTAAHNARSRVPLVD